LIPRPLRDEMAVVLVLDNEAGKVLPGQIGRAPVDRHQAHVETRENDTQHLDRQDRIQMWQCLEDPMLLALPTDARQDFAEYAGEWAGRPRRACRVASGRPKLAGEPSLLLEDRVSCDPARGCLVI